MAKYICVISFIFFILFGYVLFTRHDEFLHVYFLNVGQGDGMYIRTSDGYDMVLDTGPDLLVLHELGKVLPFYDHTINLLVITHPDADHITGAIEIMRRYSVEHVLVSGKIVGTPQYAAFEEEIHKQQLDVIYARAGSDILFGNAHIKVFYPRNDEDAEDENVNDTSVVLHFEYGDVAFLFTGDASEAVEKEIMAYENNLKSTVIKLGHHGSKNSSSIEFLRAVSPEVAVIQSGESNRFGHPHQETLERMKSLSIPYLRNDEHDTIHFRCNVTQCFFE